MPLRNRSYWPLGHVSDPGDGAREDLRGPAPGRGYMVSLCLKSLPQGEEIHIDNHCHCSHVFFFWGRSLLSRRLSLTCSGCYRVAELQTSKASEASSNHVLFTKQKGVRQIHSSCQKKQMVLRCITVSTCITISSMIWILTCLHLSSNTPTKFTRYVEGKAEINGFSPSFSSFRSFHRSGEAQ